MKKRYVLFLIILVIIAGGYSQRDTLVTRLLQTGIDRQFASSTIESLGDGLHVALCGAGSPLPAPKASGPCVAVIANGELYFVDVALIAPVTWRVWDGLLQRLRVFSLPIFTLITLMV